MAVVANRYGPGTSGTVATASNRTAHHSQYNAGERAPDAGAVGLIVTQPEVSTTPTGTVDVTNAADTATAAGTTTVTGTSAKTNANDTSTTTATTTVVGTSAKTNANDTATASGSPVVSGTVAKTNAADTATASGTVTAGGTTTADDSHHWGGGRWPQGGLELSLAQQAYQEALKKQGRWPLRREPRLVIQAATGSVHVANYPDRCTAHGVVDPFNLLLEDEELLLLV